MDDATEQTLLERMDIWGFEENQFRLKRRSRDDMVVPPLRPRSMCSRCQIGCPTDGARLWHQFVHEKAYDGFLDGKTYLDMAPFDFYYPCPNPSCHMKFEDLIDAKFHYMMDHKCLQLYCCGERHHSYGDALQHIMVMHGFEWPKKDHAMGNLQPYYVCLCCRKSWPTRQEYNAHLQGKTDKCPDPVCKSFFSDNEACLRHFFEVHYKHLTLDTRHILLSYKVFLKYETMHKERCQGTYSCSACHRHFYNDKRLEKHLSEDDCLNIRKTYNPVIECKCGHQFVYCFHQRDILLRLIPILREALQHIEREAPYSRMPEDVISIYRSIIGVLGDVNTRLIQEKYTNYHRTCSLKHSSFTKMQTARILLGAIEYFTSII